MGIANRLLAVTGIIAGCVSALYAYEEWNIPNLTAPTRIEAPALEAQIQHQFQGFVNEKNAASNFFGAGDGADAFFGVRATLLPGAQLYTSYDTHQNQSGTHAWRVYFRLLIYRVYSSPVSWCPARRPDFFICQVFGQQMDHQALSTAKPSERPLNGLGVIPD